VGSLPSALRCINIYIVPRPSHNVYTKIIIPRLSEGSLPRALRCINIYIYIYIYILPRPSHNVYTKIIIPWLSEGSLPRALRCINIYIVPRPSHNVYTKIIIPRLREGSLPRVLRCIKPNEIFSQHGRNRILRAGNTSGPHNCQPGKKTSLHTTGRNWKKGEGRRGGHVTDHVIKEHKKKDRTWLPRDS
jgi:hypothetical protein